MFEPLNLFPNYIFLPKIVPLVYDDTLSYYEFLCKVLNKLNEAISTLNDIGVDVEELKTAVERLAGLIDGFDDRITANETAIQTLNGAVQAVEQALNSALVDLRAVEVENEEQNTRISALETQIETDIAAAVAALQEEIGEVSADVTALGSQVNSNTGRIEALEEATLNAPTEGNENMIVGQFQNLSNLDYEIVEVTNNGSATNNIQVVDGLIRMLPQPAYNEMAIVIKNVLPNLVGTFTSSQILSFGLKYKTSGSNNGTDYCVNVPFTSLTGSSPYVANTGYTSTRASLRVLQLKASTDGKSYDLWIYNRYHGDYGILAGANIDILAMAVVFRGFDSSFSTSSIKAYFTTVYGNKAAQVAGLIDKKSSGIVTTAVNSANNYTDIHTTQALSEAKEYSDYIDYYNTTLGVMNSTSGYVSFNAIDPSVINPDITVSDYSKFGLKIYSGTGEPVLTPYSEELDIFINIEVTISGSGAVNTPASIPVLNITNTKGATIPHMIPLTAVAALPTKAPFTEAYLNTNGNVIFRCWFDDTNYDYDNNPITVRIAGFVPLPYQVNS